MATGPVRVQMRTSGGPQVELAMWRLGRETREAPGVERLEAPTRTPEEQLRDLVRAYDRWVRVSLAAGVDDADEVAAWTLYVEMVAEYAERVSLSVEAVRVIARGAWVRHSGSAEVGE